MQIAPMNGSLSHQCPRNKASTRIVTHGVPAQHPTGKPEGVGHRVTGGAHAAYQGSARQWAVGSIQWAGVRSQWAVASGQSEMAHQGAGGRIPNVESDLEGRVEVMLHGYGASHSLPAAHQHKPAVPNVRN